ncbi:(deoxy)nucleoside triphosphate pyrophosphohydrolase [Glycomyces buryatensis]|uniref:8-oxo-dGTP diphosphatase n=1 Tax=Glycomyces buryatensis TaxID=2570927 RepID=A0A4S8QF35_9ACTN|nr:(deoxy)nucleoside triphosphate pyrophosphohydrolase [Glycomyces buryatensis]
MVVAAAICAGEKVLAAARSYPPEMAGQWEFPGGKVEPGETETEALRRECREELGVEIEVGERFGGDLSTTGGRFLVRVYLARILSGEPEAREHADLRWLAADDLDSVPWLPGNRLMIDDIRELLAG